jgi:plasmid stabilization system protein ParE
MAEFRLTERARADLIDIYDVTESKFGAYQADAYYSGLVRSFAVLAFNHTRSSTRCRLTAPKFAPSFTTPKTSGRNFSNS